MKLAVAQALKKEPNLRDAKMQYQFEKLLLEPLAFVPNTEASGGLTVVIDALDECRRDDITLFLQLLKDSPIKCGLFIRIFVTSRPEVPIEVGFRRIGSDFCDDIVLEEAQALDIEDDIRKYFWHEFAKIKDERMHLNPPRPLPNNWPTIKDVEALVKSAGPLFIFASTVCRFVAEKSPKRRLDAIIEGQQDASTLHLRDDHSYYLRSLYLQILQEIEHGFGDNAEGTNKVKSFREVVGSLICLRTPLSISQFTRILGTDDDDDDNRMVDVLDQLRSVIRIPRDRKQPLQFLHLSFQELLLDSSHHHNEKFRIDRREAHALLYKRCLQYLSRPGVLRRDMMNVGNFVTTRDDFTAEQIEEFIPRETSYACRFLLHFRDSEAKLCNESVSELCPFLECHFLHWIETMEWTRKFIDMGNDLITLTADLHVALESCSKVSCTTAVLRRTSHMTHVTQDTCNADCCALVADALKVTRFLSRRDGWSHQCSPLQLYQRAQFLPMKYISRFACFREGPLLWDRVANLTVTGQERDDWRYDMAPLCSPDGRTIALGLKHGTVLLWDINNKLPLRALEGHSSRCKPVAFSQETRTIATTGQTSELRLWDVCTGALKQILMHAHDTDANFGIYAAAFSPDGQLVAVESAPNVVRIWNAQNGQLVVSHTLGTGARVSRIEFSPDGHSVACTQWTVLDVYAMMPMPQRLQAETLGVTYILSVDSCKVLQTLQPAHASPAPIASLAFSKDGRQIVVSTDQMRRWDLQTAALLQTIDRMPVQLSFSTDAEHLQTEGGRFAVERDLSINPEFCPPESGGLQILCPSYSDGFVKPHIFWCARPPLRLRWLTYQSTKLLDISDDLFLGSAVLHGQTLIMGNVDGIGVYRFNPEAMTHLMSDHKSETHELATHSPVRQCPNTVWDLPEEPPWPLSNVPVGRLPGFPAQHRPPY
jgi:WD40 repeat protein